MRLLIFLLIALFISAPQADAQFNKLKDKFGKKNKSEEKAEKKKKPKLDLGSLIGGNSNIELESSYNFDFAIDWLVNTEDLKEPMEMSQLYSSEKNYFGMVIHPEENNAGVEKATMLIDFYRNYLIMINEDDAQALVMAFEDIEDQVAKSAENQKDNNWTIRKTGDSKMIAGYLCWKYVYTSDEGNGEMWATKDLDYNNVDMFKYFQKMNKENKIKENNVWNSGVEGFILAIAGTDEDGEEFDMTAVKVDENADIGFEMEAYDKTDLTNLPKGLGGK